MDGVGTGPILHYITPLRGILGLVFFFGMGPFICLVRLPRGLDDQCYVLW